MLARMSAAKLEELLEIEGRDVLDVGCGEGGLARRLAWAGARVVGLDPQPAPLQRARAAEAEGPAPRYVQGAAEALPFEDAVFDVVLFFNSLHHVPVGAMDGAIEQAARVLRPAGTLYVQEPLARGPAFELLRPIDDETAIRAAALAALDRAPSSLWIRAESFELSSSVRHPDFATLRARVLAVDPARATAFDAHEHALRKTFRSLGRPAAEGGYAFEQPFRIELLRRV